MRFKTNLEKQAFSIGIDEANENGYIVTAAHSDRMMSFIEEHSKSVGDCIPWLKAYNKGVAAEISRQTREEFCI